MPENQVSFVGRLTRDIEIKRLDSAKAVGRTAIAVEKRWMRNGEWQKKASFFDVVLWESLAENAQASLKKGYRVIVTGTLEQRTWETDSGDKRSQVELVADSIGPDLRFVTCEVKGISRNDEEF